METKVYLTNKLKLHSQRQAASSQTLKTKSDSHPPVPFSHSSQVRVCSYFYLLIMSEQNRKEINIKAT
jgi:hypothetical protein